MSRRLSILLAILVLVLPAPVSAAVALPVTDTVPVRISPIHTAYELGGIPWEEQGWSNCGPVTTNMVLGYYGIHLTQAYTAHQLRPDPRDVSVTPIELVTFAQLRFGFDGQLGVGGSLQLLQALVANGLPVIVLQPLSPGSDLNHFRVVRGYDSARHTVTVNDSLLGQDLVWSESYFQSLWDTLGDMYVLIYPPQQEMLVQAIIGQYGQMLEKSREDRVVRTRAMVDKTPTSAWSWLRLGQALYYDGRLRQAAWAWGRAERLGLPDKALWYSPWPVAMLNDAGRYRVALKLADGAVSVNPASAEMYFERARSYDALGDHALALANLRLAVHFAPYHPVYLQALADYGKQQAEMTVSVPGARSLQPAAGSG